MAEKLVPRGKGGITTFLAAVGWLAVRLTGRGPFLSVGTGRSRRRPGLAEGESITKLLLKVFCLGLKACNVVLEAVFVCAEARVFEAKLTIFISKAFVRLRVGGLGLELAVLITKTVVFILDALD